MISRARRAILPLVLLACSLSARGAQAYFVVLQTSTAPGATVTIAPPAGGLYGAASQTDTGTIWNQLPYITPALNPAGNIGNPATGSAVGTYTLYAAPRALVDSTGAVAPGTLNVAVNYVGNTANGFNTVTQTDTNPQALFGGVWRLTNGANSLTYTIADLPAADALYDLYLYAANASTSQQRGATLTLATANIPTDGTASIATTGVSSAASADVTLFGSSGQLINQGATWNVIRARTDASRRIVFTQSKLASGQNWCSGFQLVPVAVPPVPETPLAIPLPASSQISAVGGSATFAATVTGPEPLLCRWYFETTPLSDGLDSTGTTLGGTTTATLSLANIQSARAGRYHLVVTSGAASVSSPAAALTLVTFAPPSIPDRTFNASAYGATPDDATEDTTALQAAINAASTAGGGTVIVPPGVFLCGPITLKNSIHLRLSPGTILRMLPIYSWPNSPYSTGTTPDFIQVNNLANVVISGFGTIDGQGQAWWDRVDGTNGVTQQSTVRPGSTIGINDSTACAILDVSTLNPPNQHFGIKRIHNVVVANATLRAPGDSPNTDGINMGGQNLVVDHCDISTGDDNVVVSAGTTSGEVKDVRITNCVIGEGHGCSIGSYTSGGTNGGGGYYGVKNVTVDRITFNGTLSGLTLKSSPGRGGVIQNLSYTNLTMNNVGSPFTIHSYYGTVGSPGATGSNGPTPATAATYNATPPVPLNTALLPEWKDILISDVVVNGCTNYAVIWGLPNRPVRGLTLRNISYNGSWGIRVYNATDVVFSGTNSFTLPSNRPLFTTYNANIISASPASATINQGAPVSFTAATAGAGGVSGAAATYGWLLDGAPLSNGTQPDGTVVSGATTRTLSLANTGARFAGAYTFVASNLLDGYDVATSARTPASISAQATTAATLTVQTSFSIWSANHGLDPATTGAPDADPDADGVSNQLEFFLGRSPAATDAADSLPALRVTPGATPALVFEFRRAKAAATVPYTVEYTADLGTPWTTAVAGADGVLIETTPLDANFDRVTVTLPSTAPKIFLRLKL